VWPTFHRKIITITVFGGYHRWRGSRTMTSFERYDACGSGRQFMSFVNPGTHRLHVDAENSDQANAVLASFGSDRKENKAIA
jgi:hypothetical protein